MRKFLAFVVLACASALAYADTSLTGTVVAVDSGNQTVTLVPPGWHPPMQLLPPKEYDEDTFEAMAWIFANESPAPLIWLVDTDPVDGVFDSWSRY